MPAPPVLAFRDAAAGYRGREVLSALNLTVERGLVHAVVGATGCGKTTLLNLMAGLVSLERGSAEFGLSDDRRRIALIPQDYGLFPWKTVRANALMGIEIRNGRRATAADRERVAALLAELGIGELGERWPATLSGGQKQRTAIARALAPEPALLLMDEPFSALDADIREDLQDLVRALPSRHGTTPVLVTHDIAEALRVADRILLFRPTRRDSDGRIPGDGAARFAVECIPNDESRSGELRVLLRGALRSSRGREGNADAWD